MSVTVATDLRPRHLKAKEGPLAIPFSYAYFQPRTDFTLKTRL
jgi:hypothetical protein